MPSRYVREGLVRSQRFNELEFIEQSIYVRLLLIVDDFGCFDGRENIISSQACPLWANGEGVDAVYTALKHMHAVGLIVRYVNAQQPFIAITQWGGEYREYRKFPAPPINNDIAAVGGKPLKVRPKYGREINWANPAGFDDVSILLDLDGRAAVPQPPEWRNRNDWTPVTMRRSHSAPVTVLRPTVTEVQSLEVPDSDCVPRGGVGVVTGGGNGVGGGVGGGDGVVTAAQSLQAPAPTTTANEEEKIEFKDGAFAGLTERQRLAWQDMFHALSIPDQVDRAAAWLAVNRAERDAIEKRGEGFGSFIVRWLLRESRGAKHA